MPRRAFADIRLHRFPINGAAGSNMKNLRIVALVGSLRRESYTRRVVNALSGLVAGSMHIEIVPIGSLPLYDEDADVGTPPAAWQAFRDRIRDADGVLFATPEYNRSIPGGMKNAIDVGSRPYGASVWSGKPAAVISVSPGAIGAFGANHHLRQCLTFLDMPVLQQPEAYLGGVDRLIDASGAITRPDAAAFLKSFADAFGNWVKRLSQEKAA
jgi:chromate reductase, NAD(P)H dehydrogenase (quinone)